MSQSPRFSVHNPQGRLQPTGGTESTAASSAALAPRADELEGKTVYLVDTGFGGSYLFMQQLQKWMSEHMPGVATIRRRKPGHVFADDTDVLWEEIKAKGAAGVVIGVGG